MPAHVGRDIGSTSLSVSSVATAGTSHTAGNALLIIVGYQNTVDTIVLSNTAGDTFIPAGPPAINGNNRTQYFYVKSTNGNASDVVTATFSGLTGSTAYCTVVVHEFSGFPNAALYVDFSFQSATGSSAAPDTGANISLLGGTSGVILAFVVANSGGNVQGSGYTGTAFNYTGDPVAYAMDEWKVVTADEHATSSCTSAAWGISAVMFRTAARSGISPESYVEGSSGGAFTGSQTTTAKTRAAGNGILALVYFQQDASFPSDCTGVTNTAGDTFTQVGSRLVGPTNKFMSIFYCPNSAGATNDVVSFAFSGTFGAVCNLAVVVELSGQDNAAAAMDYQTYTAGPGINHAVTPALTLTSRGFIGGITTDTSSQNYTPDAGFGPGSIRNILPNAIGGIFPASSQTAGVTWPGVDFAMIVAAAIKEASGTPPPNFVQQPKPGMSRIRPAFFRPGIPR